MLIALGVAGVILLLIPHFLQKEDKTENEKSTNVTYYSEMLENKLTELLSGAEGVGSVQVVVTLDKTGEYVYAKDESSGNGQSSADYVIINAKGVEEAILVSEIYPKVRGVAVVCSGGKSSEVKKRVTELISAALGISANKIAVSG